MAGYRFSKERGFTLVEMIMVIVITGIIGGMVAIFIRVPVQGYVDSARRADMADIADTALRRITRDLRLALPNSVRVTISGPQVYLEYLETIAGGRYNTATMPVDCLNAGSCTALTTVSNLVSGAAGTPSVILASGQGSIVLNTSRVVVYNQYNNSANDCTTANPSVYCGHGAPIITGVTNGTPNATEDVITFAATTFYPSGGSPNNRFQIVSQPVTYVCNPVVGGGGTLTRYWGYAIQAAQPSNTAAAPLSTASHALLATNVSSCNFSYDAFVVAQRSGLVTMRLTITNSGESVSLYNAAHVSNTP
ncbi:MAG: type II secretion system protein [Nitrosomonadales bacterium]|nr:type II secretion system protein [Nitrosomonadales bacterium]